MLGEQIRDWRIALGAFSELPLVGTPSTAGGTTLGPVYYWWLWISRVLIGPLVDDLPHAGGIGISLLQSVADALLVVALARRFGSIVPALAVVVFAATSPYDLVLSAIVWNPPVAVAFVKLAIAAALRSPGVPSPERRTAVVACSWFAVQAHSAAVFFAVPAIAWAVLAESLATGRPATAARPLAIAAGVVLLLQAPYLLHHARNPAARGAAPNPFTRSLSRAVADPGSLRLAESGHALARATSILLWSPPGWRWGLACAGACGLVLAVRHRRDAAMLAVSVAPLFCTWLGFAMLDRPLTEYYWYVSVMPCAALTVVAGARASIPARVRPWGTAVLLAAATAWAPYRVIAAWNTVPMPEYGILVEASRDIVQRTPEVRAIVAPFLPPTAEPAFVYEILGGRVARASPWVATVAPDGRVRYNFAP